MLAVIWHWWIGLAMLFAAGLTVAALVAGYLKQVSSQRYPSGKRARGHEL